MTMVHTNEATAEVTLPTAQVEAPAPASPDLGLTRIRVRIRKVNGTFHIDCGSHPCPQYMTDVWPYLTNATERANARAYRNHDIQSALEYLDGLVPLQSIADAIAQCIFRRFTRTPEAEKVLGVTQASYLAMGDIMYRLTPVEVLPATRVLRTLRARAIEQAKAEADQIKEAAQSTANTLIADATRQRAEATRIRQRAEAEAIAAPPRWMLEALIPLRTTRDEHGRMSWCAGYFITFKPHTILFKLGMGGERIRYYKWRTADAPAVRTLIYTPIKTDGSYNFRASVVDLATPMLPHITTMMACAQPADSPALITRPEHIQALAISVERTFGTIEMHSLLLHTDHWPAEIKAFLPPALCTYIESYQWSEVNALTRPVLASECRAWRQEMGLAHPRVPIVEVDMPTPEVTETTITQETNETWRA